VNLEIQHLKFLVVFKTARIRIKEKWGFLTKVRTKWLGPKGFGFGCNIKKNLPKIHIIFTESLHYHYLYTITFF